MSEDEDNPLIPSPRSRVKPTVPPPTPPTSTTQKPTATIGDALRIDPERKRLLDSLTIDEQFYVVLRFGELVDRVKQLSGVGAAAPQRFSPPVPRPKPPIETGRKRTVPLPEGVQSNEDLVKGIDYVEQQTTGSVGDYPATSAPSGEGGGISDFLINLLITNPRLGESIANMIDNLTNSFTGFMQKMGKPKGE